MKEQIDIQILNDIACESERETLKEVLCAAKNVSVTVGAKPHQATVALLYYPRKKKYELEIAGVKYGKLESSKNIVEKYNNVEEVITEMLAHGKLITIDSVETH